MNHEIFANASGPLGLARAHGGKGAYVSAWVKKHVWRLPVEVPYVPKRRRLGFAAYAVTSGLYSYTVLFILARFVGNIFRNFNPEWSFVAEFATGALIFRSRIRSAVNFMKFIYLDKKNRAQNWLTSHRLRWSVAGIIGLLFLPLWRESISGRFVLEATDRAVIRAQLRSWRPAAGCSRRSASGIRSQPARNRSSTWSSPIRNWRTRPARYS